MTIGDALGAIMSGGLTGIVGSAITAFSEIKKQKMLFQHEEKMEELSIQALKMETEANLKLVEVETEGKITIADATTLAESYKADMATYSQEAQKGKVTSFLLVMVDVLRGLIRPLITFYFTVLISILFFRFYSLYSRLEDLSKSAEILDNVVLVILYVGTTCILWWFGTRNKIFNGKKL